MTDETVYQNTKQEKEFDYDEVVGHGYTLRVLYGFTGLRRETINCGNSAVSAAAFAKNADYKIFGVAFEASDIGQEYLGAMASENSYYTADTAGLNAVFQGIAQQILNAVQDATMVDPMGQGFFIPDTASIVRQVPASPAPTVAAGGKHLQWQFDEMVPLEGVEDVSYAELVYRIEIDNEILDATPNGELYQTNNNAVFTYTDAEGKAQTLPFPLPEVNPVLYIVKKTVQDKDGNDITETLKGERKRIFDIQVSQAGNPAAYLADYTIDTELYKSSTLITTLRNISNYRIQEVGEVENELEDYNVTYIVDGVEVSSPENPGPATFFVADNNQQDIHIEIINREKPASLTVSKTVKPLPGQSIPDTAFNLKLEKVTDNGVELIAEFTLKHGESKTFDDLSFGTYRVTEEVNENMYFTEMWVGDDQALPRKEIEVDLALGARTKHVHVANTSKEVFGISAYKTWIDREGEVVTNHPTIYFQLYRRDPGDETGTTDIPVGPPRQIPEPSANDVPARVEWTQAKPETYGNDDTNFVKTNDAGDAYVWYVKEVDANGADFTPFQYAKIEDGMRVYNHKVRQTEFSIQKKLKPENISIEDHNKKFYFDLYKKNPETEEWVYFAMTRNTNGSAVFRNIDLPVQMGEENALEYKLQETPVEGTSLPDWYEFDKTQYLIRVYTLADPEHPEAPLEAHFKYFRLTDQEGNELSEPQEIAAPEFEFVNTYVAEGEWQPKFTKQINGNPPIDNKTFTFILKKDGQVISDDFTVTSDPVTGEIVFPKIQFTTEDAGQTYFYTIQEVVPDPPEEGMEYDKAPREIRVKIVDDHQGKLTPVVTYEIGTIFNNRYIKDAEWTPEITKSMVGRKLTGGEFSFDLLQVEPPGDDGQPILLQSNVTNDSDGKVHFETIEYNTNQLGQTFTYHIKEHIPDNKETGMTYDEQTLVYKITVREDGKGLIFDERPDAEVFTNVYTANGAWKPEINKTLTGRPLTDGAFTFYLHRVNADGTKTLLQTKTNDAAGQVPFTQISYTAKDIEQIFVYEITEKDGGEAGMTYDASTLTFRVKIVDRKNGKLEAVLVDEDGFALADPEALDRTFDNHYKASGTWTPQVQKHLNDKPATVNRFKFTLQQTDDGMVYQDTANQNPDGVVTFMPITFTEQDIGETYNYTIAEENVGEAGMTYDTKKIKVTLKITDGGNGKLNFQATYDPDPAVFKNTYKAKGEWTPYVLKNLNDQPAPEGRFSFKLWRDDESEDDAEIQANDVNGKVTFETIKYDEKDIDKVYVYHVKEVVPTPPETGMTYDTRTLTFRVKIVDSTLGNLTPTLVDENDQPLENPENLNRTFNNTYEASGSYTPYVIKKVNGGKVAAEAERFAFNLEQIGGPHKQKNVTNDANGKVTFDTLTFDQKDIGKIFAYKITEVIPADPDPNMTYDAQPRYLRLKVSDGQNGTLKIETVDASGAVIVLKDADRTFNNLLQTDSTWAPEVTKQMNGKNPEKGRFSFLLTDVTQEDAPKVLQTVSNWSDGTIPFAPIKFNQDDVDKTFKYTIQEVAPESPEDGMTYDPMLVTVSLDVTYENGKMVFTPTYSNENLPAGTTTPDTQFDNAYKAEGTWTPYVLKNLNGEPAPEGRFSFKLWQDGESEDDAEIQSNDANGKVTFETIAYDEKDIGKVYVYHVKEVVPETPEDGMTYDTGTLTFRVKIVDKHNGKLEPVLVDEHNQPLEQPDNPDRRTFNNTYTATGSWAPELTKKLYKGAEDTDELSLTKDQFKFRIMQTDPNTDYKEFVGNDADGSIKFKKLSFTEADIGATYHYVITEVPGEDTGMQYDSITRELALTIEDGGNGELTFTPVYTLQPASAGVAAETFVNRYTATGAWTPQVTKILTGRQLEEDEFSFTLTQTDDVNEPYSETVTNQGNGTIPFTAIQYTEADIGKTYTYQIQEVVPAAQEEGMTYDKTVRTYQVKILAGKNGKLDVKVTLVEGTTSVFKNSYKATGAWAPVVTKKLIGGPLKDDKYSFTLTQTDKVENPYSETVKNLASGKIPFAEITYTQADIGRTYHYKVVENEGEDTGTLYDKLEVTFEVKIKDAGGGKLTVTATHSGDTEFNNSYNATGEWAPRLAKTLEGRELEDKEFTFVLEKVDVQNQKTEEIASVKNQADGTIQFAAVKYTADDIDKTYTYRIREVEPETPEIGMAYDETVMTYTVEITDAGNGKLKVDVTEPEKPTFTNTFTEYKGSWMPEVTKSYTGGPQLEDDMFEFMLLDGKGNELQRVKNKADGTIPFEEIPYTQADIGSYTYKIKEVEPDPAETYITYDTEVRTVEVTVSFDETTKKLVVTATDIANPVFTNTYHAKASWTPEITKVLEGRKLTENEFTFELYEMQDTGETDPATGEPIREKSVIGEPVTNDAAGRVAFPELTLTEKDFAEGAEITRTYYIAEVIPADEDAEKGMTYAAEPIEVTVKAEHKGEGIIEIDVAYTADATLTNTYHGEQKVTWTPEATKELAGKTLAKGDFTFELVQGDTVLESVKNGADGKILFSPLSYTWEDAGDYTYSIREVKGSDPRVTYDPMTIEVKVKVTYDKTADKLAIEVTYPDDTTFNNTFKESEETDILWEPEIRKLLKGRELMDGEFSFVLESETGSVLRTASNNKNGRVRFTPLRFTAADAGKTFIYKVRELPYAANGRPDPTITYDDHVLIFAVTVKKTATHTLELAVSTQGDLDFRNTYTPTQPIVWHRELISDWHHPTPSEPPAPTRTVIPATGEQRTLWPAVLTLLLAVALLALRKRRP